VETRKESFFLEKWRGFGERREGGGNISEEIYKEISKTIRRWVRRWVRKWVRKEVKTRGNRSFIEYVALGKTQRTA
jgi:hypothetical protein